MSDDVVFVVRLCTAIGCGLMAGLFFAFSVSVMPGLRRRPPAEGMAAMQAINATILNPVFLIVFFGTALLCVAALVSAYTRWREAGAAYFATGAGFYLVGALLVTIAMNVPMNDALARTAPAGADAERLWKRYLTRWTAWNHVRLLASVAAAIALTVGLCADSFELSISPRE